MLATHPPEGLPGLLIYPSSKAEEQMGTQGRRLFTAAGRPSNCQTRPGKPRPEPATRRGHRGQGHEGQNDNDNADEAMRRGDSAVRRAVEAPGRAPALPTPVLPPPPANREPPAPFPFGRNS